MVRESRFIGSVELEFKGPTVPERLGNTGLYFHYRLRKNEL